MLKKLLIVISWLIWFLSLSLPCAGDEGQGDTANKIDQLMQKGYKYRLFTGSVLLAKQGSVIYQKSFGPADRRWNIPNRINTKYKIGSITKQFTAMLILQLVQEGKLLLDGKVSHYLEYYPKDKGNRITIHHLLCHAGGIPNLARHYKDWFTVRWMKEYSYKSFIKLFSHLDLDFEPGSRWSYSNAGYYLLAAIIEKVSGKTYSNAVEGRIFKPLGMTDSGYFDGYTIVPRLATGYEYWNFRYSNTGYNSATTHKGNGGLYSTVGDLLKWDQALYTTKLLNRKYLNLMFQPHMSMRSSVNYSYGWVLRDKFLSGQTKPVHVTEHFGSDLGFNNVITRIHDERYLIILLSNTSQSDIPLLRDEIISILYNHPFFLPKPLSLALNICKNESEVQGVIRDFNDQGEKFSIRQDRVNGVGFKFVRAKKYSLGLAILEFNASQFPRSPFVYESLGEAYMMAVNKPMALKNFKKLLEIDPRNPYAKNRIKELERK